MSVMEDVSREVLRQWDVQHLWHPLAQHQVFQSGAAPLIITDGQGAVVYDIDGHPYLDAAAGLWCVNVGYGREELVEAATAQLRRLAYYPLTQSHPSAIALSRKLAEYLPHTPHVYFSNSGSEANELAFKAVRQYWKQAGRPRKVKILSRHRGYHGTTMGALSATGQHERRRDYEPFVPGFIQVSAPYCYRCPFHLEYPGCSLQCALDFERRIEIEDPETVAAIVVEPVVAGGGVIVPPQDYLRQVASIARRYDVKLIVDEVVTGFGRTGDMFAHSALGVEPDVVTMAKGLASGYMPIGATAFSEEMFQGFLGGVESGRHLRHVNTYAGHPVAAAVALANIGVIERDGLVERARTVGGLLLQRFREALSGLPWVGEVRGRGLLVGIELVQPEAASRAAAGSSNPVASTRPAPPVPDSFMRGLAKYLLANGVIAGKMTDVQAHSNNVLMFAPPLVITEEQAETLVRVVRRGIEQVGGTAP
ncbi:MAG: aminotransferase class III-fold pyridoxal phosphate-dependent enzyme [Alicyclobacillus sp.]|nr:aminotransferase class III-fold pyridoxal phosphate-dependent enzyme [Alicyclobacillus sp.]